MQGPPRLQYTCPKKGFIVKMTKELIQEQGWSICRCAAKFGVYHTNLLKWLHTKETILEKSSKKIVHSGPSGQLEDSKESIHKWIFECGKLGLLFLVVLLFSMQEL